MGDTHIAERFVEVARRLQEGIKDKSEEHRPPAGQQSYPVNSIPFVDIFEGNDDSQDRTILAELMNGVVGKAGFMTTSLEEMPLVRRSDRYARFELSEADDELLLYTNNIDALHQRFPTVMSNVAGLADRIKSHSLAEVMAGMRASGNLR